MPVPDAPQNLANHRRWYPLYHFFVLPILLLNVAFSVVDLVRAPGRWTAWGAVVAIAIAVGFGAARAQALKVQDRVIRLEEILRMQRLLPSDLQGHIGGLTRGQIVALRFASDEELPDLVRRVRSGDLPEKDDIKRAIRHWRPDELRA